MLFFISIVLLMVIAYQDFKERTISLWLLPVLFTVFIIQGLQTEKWLALSRFFFLNCSFLLLQFILLTIYFSIKQRKFTVITENHIGWGDFLLLAVLGVFFSPFNFITFYLISLFVILAVFLGFRAFKKNVRPAIPLAGGLALIMILLMAGRRFFFSGFNFYDDSSLLSLVNL